MKIYVLALVILIFQTTYSALINTTKIWHQIIPENQTREYLKNQKIQKQDCFNKQIRETKYVSEGKDDQSNGVIKSEEQCLSPQNKMSKSEQNSTEKRIKLQLVSQKKLLQVSQEYKQADRLIAWKDELTKDRNFSTIVSQHCDFELVPIEIESNENKNESENVWKQNTNSQDKLIQKKQNLSQVINQTKNINQNTHIADVEGNSQRYINENKSLDAEIKIQDTKYQTKVNAEITPNSTNSTLHFQLSQSDFKTMSKQDVAGDQYVVGVHRWLVASLEKLSQFSLNRIDLEIEQSYRIYRLYYIQDESKIYKAEVVCDLEHSKYYLNSLELLTSQQ